VAVTCPKCHSDKPETLKFCEECGTQLSSLKDIHPEVTETFQTPIKELTTGSTFAGRDHEASLFNITAWPDYYLTEWIHR
jgi:hypothetical protein